MPATQNDANPRPTTFVSINQAALEKFLRDGSHPQQQLDILQLLHENIALAGGPLEETTVFLIIVTAWDMGDLKTKQDPWHLYKFYRVELRNAGVLVEATPAYFAIGYDKGEGE